MPDQSELTLKLCSHFGVRDQIPYCDIVVQVECYDYDNDGSHDLIGIFETTMTRLKEASRSSPVGNFTLSYPGSCFCNFYPFFLLHSGRV